MINIKNDLKSWLVQYITNTIHTLESDNDEFNQWAKSFEQSEAEFVVDMEFINDFGYDTRDEISEEEAKDYADGLVTTIVDRWYF